MSMNRRIMKNMKRNHETRKSYPVDALNAVSVFYGVEALLVYVTTHKNYEPMRHSHAKLVDDITEYQRVLTDTLADMLYNYTALACYGELLHSSSQSSVRYKGKSKNSIRNTCHTKEALKYSPESILNVCTDGFDNKYSWSCSFGGDAWKRIAKHGLTYHKYSNKEFCDTSFSLSHNTAPYINKEDTRIFFLDDNETYLRMLDTKFSKTPKQIIKFILSEFYLDTDYFKFLKRALNLGFFRDNIYISKHIIEPYSWQKDSIHSLMNTIKIRYKAPSFKGGILKVSPYYANLKTKREQDFFTHVKIGANALPEFEHCDYFFRTNKHEFENFVIVDRLNDGKVEIKCVENGHKKWYMYKTGLTFIDNNKTYQWKELVKREVKSNEK